MATKVFSALLCSLVIASVHLVNAQDSAPESSWPHPYPGMPTGDLSPEWQNYFQVTQPLTNVTWELGRNWAGNIPIGRAGHPNDTLFFWAFEKEEGSLTAAANENNDKPWGIWLEGPGVASSSMIGLTSQNGPIQIADDYSVSKNDFSWNTVADWMWVDEPLGAGFSTLDAESAVSTADQVAEDFLGFLENLVKVFPSLKTRPLHLVGESYGGKFVSYILKHYFGRTNPPVNLRKIAIGRGAIGPLSLVETYPQLINYDPKEYEFLKEQVRLCGYDYNLTYPQSGKLPTPLGNGNRDDSRIDAFYGCNLQLDVGDYAFNNSMPYKIADYPWVQPRGNSVRALALEILIDPSVFFNDAANRAALHAPTSKDWSWGLDSWDSSQDGAEPMVFFDELATNATSHNVSIVMYARNDDPYYSHRGTDMVIQNTTFGGIQGFTRKPSTPWTDDNGNFAGIVHQERDWTYVLVNQSGWFYPQPARERTSVMLREFVIGNNQTGLVTTVNGETTVVGGEDPDLYARGVLAGPLAVPYRKNGTIMSYTYPSATVAAWAAYTATAIPTIPVTSTSP